MVWAHPRRTVLDERQMKVPCEFDQITSTITLKNNNVLLRRT